MKWLVLFLAAAITSAAAAQSRPLLDLSAAPAAPAAGEGAGTLALAAQLAADADTIGDATPDARIRAQLRLSAREFLLTGEKSGQSGSARIMLGRTLAAALPHLDRLASTADVPRLLACEAELTAARRRLESGSEDADLVLRDGLAILSAIAGPAPARGGWIDQNSADSTDTPGLDAWSSLPGVTSEATDAIRELESLASAAAPYPSHLNSIARTLRIITAAARSFDSCPAWLSESARTALASQWSTAVTTLQSRRADAFGDLARLAAAADLIRRADVLDDNAVGKRIRASIAQSVTVPASQSDARTLESYAQLLALINARRSWPEEKSLIRQLRPGYRLFTAAARQTEQNMLLGLPEVLRRPEAMTDPGILASISAHRRAIADVEGLLAIHQAFLAPGDGEPAADKPWQNAANRILKLSQDLGGTRTEQKDAALTSLRALFTHIQTSWLIPGEDDLRRVVKENAGTPQAERSSIWAILSGGREAALAAEITDRRAGWLFDWEKEILGGSDAQRLDAVRALMILMHEAGPAINPGDDYAALQAWPGWEISAATLSTLASGLADQTKEATRLILAGDTAKASETIARARADFAVIILAGRLAREAHRRGISSDRSAAQTLLELTSGGPIRAHSWLGHHTELLDDVCRYSEEVVALQKLGAKDKADRVRAFANMRAGQALDALDHSAAR